MKAQDARFPYLTIDETSAPATPDAGDQRLYIDPIDHVLKRKDSDSVVRSVGWLRRTFTVNWDDANVTTTGVVLWTPRVGDWIMDAVIHITDTFTGSGGFTKAKPAIVTGATGEILLPSYLGLITEDSGTDIYKPAATSGRADGVSLAGMVAFVGGFKGVVSSLPVAMKVATSLNLVLTPDAGAMTAGQIQITFWVDPA